MGRRKGHFPEAEDAVPGRNKKKVLLVVLREIIFFIISQFSSIQQTRKHYFEGFVFLRKTKVEHTHTYTHTHTHTYIN